MTNINLELNNLKKNKKNLREVLNWFIVENNIDIDIITDKETKELITQLNYEDELDQKLFDELINKLK
jgi:hypothetical protein